MSTHRVEYVGSKPTKADNVAGTGTVWIGTGDVQSVPAAAWPKLAMHPTVWRLADAAAPAPVIETKTYADGTKATGPAPLPVQSPAEQATTARDGTSIEIAGVMHQVADIDAAAHKESGLSAEDWAGLSDADRNDFREAQIATMQLLAEKQANAALKAKPVAKTAPAKKAAAKKTAKK